MKISYLRLKGYAGIFHGMGRDEIEIDFSNFKSNIILIQGHNGCGKSTIIDSLSLEIDGSDYYRTDMIYNPSSLEPKTIDYHAEKEIHLMDGNDIYKVLIISPVSPEGKRKTTKAFISLNGEEMNPNGNVTSFKEVKNALLEMDPNYIALSHISSENRGLVDMIPSERKKFMSSVITTLDFFNNSYRNLSKKTSIFKSNINHLKSKIYNIGDSNELLARLNMLNARLTDLENQKESINLDIAESKAMIKILDPDGKIQDLYTSILSQLDEINSFINKYISSLDTCTRKLNKSYENDISIEKVNLERTIIETQGRITSSENELGSTIQSIDSIHSKINSITNQLISLESTDVREDIVDVVNDIKSQISIYEDVISKTDIDTDISKSELLFAKTVLDNIMSMVKNIREFSENDQSDVFQLLDSDKTIYELSKELDDDINDITNQISKYRNVQKDNLSLLNKMNILDQRPSTCTIDDCSFIKEAVEIKMREKNIKSTLLDAGSKILIYEFQLDQSIVDRDKMDRMIKLYGLVEELMTYINSNHSLLIKLGKIGLTFSSSKHFIELIKNHSMFEEFRLIDDYIGIIDVIELYREQKRLLSGYEADLKIRNNNMVIILSLNNELEDHKKRLENENNKIDELTRSISFDKQILTSMNNDFKIMDQIVEIVANIEDYKIKKKKLGEEFNKVKSDIADVKKYVDYLNTKEQALILLNNEYRPLKENIDQINFNISQLNSYKEELKEINSQYEKIDFIKKACNPASDGIQKIYISMYMNTTIVIANELLSYLFGGGLQLMKPIVDDGFSIPFINEFGQIVSDISKGSTSQRCMFGMCLGFALLSQGSTKYNILRMDEIDGGLDTDNRMGFMPVTFNIMEIMNVEQTFMCSHNIETETERADILFVSKSGLDYTLRH